MPIKSYKRPDGTWILWNTEESDSPPMEGPTAAGSSISGATDTTAQAQEMMMQMQEMKFKPGLEGLVSEQGYKLHPTTDDRKFMRKAVKDIKSGSLDEESSKKLAMDLLGQKLFSLHDDGSVYSAFSRIPGGQSANDAVLDFFGKFRDRTDDELRDMGMDTGSMSTEEILNALRYGSTKREGDPSITPQDWRQSLEEQIAKAKSLGLEEQ